MEPVDPRMGDLLGGGDVAGGGGPDELRAIVAKAGRRMWLRAAAVAGAVAIAAGGGVGYAVATTGGSPKQIVATTPLAGGNTYGSAASPAAPGESSSEAAGGASYAVPGAGPFTKLFTRRANGVDVRAFVVPLRVMMPLGSTGGAAVPQCGMVSRLQVELSTPAMVALAGGGGFLGQQTGSTVVDVTPAIVGEAEGDPVAVLVVLTDSTVAKVRMDFAGGTSDEMAPHQGWSALVAPASWYQSQGKTTPTNLGTLTAFDSSGRTVDTRAIIWPPGATPAAGGSSGSSTPGAGSGSGTVSSGTATVGPAGTAATSPAFANPCPDPTPCPPPSTADGAVYACPTPAPLPAVTPATTSPAKG